MARGRHRLSEQRASPSSVKVKLWAPFSVCSCSLLLCFCLYSHADLNSWAPAVFTDSFYGTFQRGRGRGKGTRTGREREDGRPVDPGPSGLPGGAASLPRPSLSGGLRLFQGRQDERHYWFPEAGPQKLFWGVFLPRCSSRRQQDGGAVICLNKFPGV